jgi:ATPase subunit of ABC transporter with duplicated ATPase domains
MQGLGKTYPGGKKVLENINLSFYPDAKIGVLSVNGAGKSTLLRIMAGIDKEFSGEGFVAEGARVGYLPQEPRLDENLDVRGNVIRGVADKQAILDRYNELAMNYSDETADEMTKLQDEIEAKGLWDLDARVDQAMDTLLRYSPMLWPSPTMARKDFGSNDGRRWSAMARLSVTLRQEQF